MIPKTKIILLILIIPIICGCGNNSYLIKEEYIKGKSGIDGFSIAELKGDKSSDEKLRVCCKTISVKSGLTNKLFFYKKNNGYQWHFCTLNLRFVENDSLRELSLEKKMEIINKENSGKSAPKYYETLPIRFKPETWYHFFGFKDIEGSYFVYVNKDRSFNVEYFEGGPF